MTKRKNSTRKKTGAKRKKRPLPKMTWRKSWRYLVVIVAFTAAAMFPVINADFTEIDDKTIILEWVPKYDLRPQRIWESGLFTPHYKPVTRLSWYLEYKTVGLDAQVLHFNNLLLHVFNSILVFFIVYKLALNFDLTRKSPTMVAVTTAVLFGIHPLHVESIAWAIGRKDVLYTLFFLLGMNVYLRYLKKPKLNTMLEVTGLFILSALSKAPAIMFPAVLLLLDFAYKRKFNLAAFKSKWPVLVAFAGVFFIYGILGNPWRPNQEGGHGQEVPEGRLSRLANTDKVSNLKPLDAMPSLVARTSLIGVKGVFWYVHTYLPVGLSLAYPYKQWIPKLSHGMHVLLLILLASGFMIYRWRHSRRFLFWTHVFFFTALVPALVRTGLGKGIFLSDRYVYLACLGLLFFISGWIIHFLNGRGVQLRFQYALLAVLGIGISFYTNQVAQRWDTGYTLWTNTIEKYPEVSMAYVNRARYHRDVGDLPNSIADYTIAINIDNDVDARISRGMMYRQSGDVASSIADFEEVLGRFPNNSYAINGMGNALFSAQRYQEAVAMYTRGLDRTPRDVGMLSNRASAYYSIGEHELALNDLDRAEQINPNYGPLYQKRAVIYMDMGDYQNVIVNGERTAQLDPRNHTNLGDLGRAYQNLNRHSEAVNAFTRALAVAPSQRRYYIARANSYQALGRMQEANQDRARANAQ